MIFLALGNVVGFQQTNNILPKILSNTKGLLDRAKEYIETELTILYVPYIYDENTYYFGIHNNPVATEVKLADLTHNMDLSRIPDGASKEYVDGMIKKRDNYMRYYNYLTKAPAGMTLREFENRSE